MGILPFMSKAVHNVLPVLLQLHLLCYGVLDVLHKVAALPCLLCCHPLGEGHGLALHSVQQLIEFALHSVMWKNTQVSTSPAGITLVLVLAAV